MTRKQIHVMTIGLLLANVMSGLDATIINTALPAIIADLHGISCMGLIVSVFLLGSPCLRRFGANSASAWATKRLLNWRWFCL